MVSLNLGWTLGLGLPVLALHLVSVTLSRALRTYSRSRLEEVCARSRPSRAGRRDRAPRRADRAERRGDGRGDRPGPGRPARPGPGRLLGSGSRHVGPAHAVEAMVAIALGVGAVGYVLAGVVGRVFAETVLDASGPRPACSAP